MKMYSPIVASVLLLSLLSCQRFSSAHTVSVIDHTDKKPIGNIEVKHSTFSPSGLGIGWGSGKQIDSTYTTNAFGMARISDLKPDDYISAGSPSYYTNQIQVNEGTSELHVIKKTSPHAMRVYAGEYRFPIDSLTHTFHYDLEALDFVTPLGCGKKEHWIFDVSFDKNNKNLYRLSIQSTNKTDGFIFHKNPDELRHSQLRSPINAPTSGYSNNIDIFHTRSGDKYIANQDDFECIIFKHTDNQVHYGKIYNFPHLHIYDNAIAGFQMTIYVNSDSTDNIEWNHVNLFDTPRQKLHIIHNTGP